MPQPFFYLAADYSSGGDFSSRTESDIGASLVSGIEFTTHTASMTPLLHDSESNILSGGNSLHYPIRAPPPSIASPTTYSSNSPATRPKAKFVVDPALCFLRFYDSHDQSDEDHFQRLFADRETVIVGVLFHDTICGVNRILRFEDLATVLKFRNKRYRQWQALTGSMVLAGFLEMLEAYDEPSSTVRSWSSLRDKDPTGDSNEYFKELKAQLIKDLESAEREVDTMKHDWTFLEKEHLEECKKDDEPSWVLLDPAPDPLEEHERRMDSVRHWMDRLV